MAIILKSREEIAGLREAGRIVAETYQLLEHYIVPGVATLELDRRAEQFIRGRGARPMYKGYHPPGHPAFPGTICVAINNVIVHGPPRKKQMLREGDIVGIDIGAVYDGWVGDACKTYAVGAVDRESSRLVDTTRECLELGIGESRVGRRIGDIGAAIQRHAEGAGFSVVREYCGHGVGRKLWEEPSVPHHGKPGTGTPLRPGMVFTIEPMLNAGGPATRLLDDGWTVVTADGSRSAQFEHSIAVTERGPEILTLP
ncbi:MAG TPA: type I methionyl aminopeptidase [Chloroflexota bacterium]|nr:type I methionyl aminopeptidase [Chloroflexota bacterium]